MSKQFNGKKIIPRYKLIAYIMLCFGFVIVVKAAYIGTVKRDYWLFGFVDFLVNLNKTTVTL